MEKMIKLLETLVKVDDGVLEQIHKEMELRKTREVFTLGALGSQTDHLIKSSIEKLGAYCLIFNPATIKARDLAKLEPKGIIWSGGPVSVYKNPPPVDLEIFDLGVPNLGICLGFQLLAQYRGIKVLGSKKKEFGRHLLQVKKVNGNMPLLFKNCPEQFRVVQNHGDFIWPDDRMEIYATTENSPVAAGRIDNCYGTQFHPEQSHTENGLVIFNNFCYEICQAKDRYPAEKVAYRKIQEIRETICNKRVILGLSGGTDSSTVAHLLYHAVGGRPGQIIGVYIKGIDRYDDEAHVYRYFKDLPWLKLIVIDASDTFLAAVRGIKDMHGKRVVMRGVYAEILNWIAWLYKASFIAQGTLYTDMSESGFGYATSAEKARIKLHHNVFLPLIVDELLPLVDCVKDSGRNIGRAIGVPIELIEKQPFPGPGLLVRIVGEVTPDNRYQAREADAVWISELRQADLYSSVWQAGAPIVDNTIYDDGQITQAAQAILEEEIVNCGMADKINQACVRINNSETTCQRGDDKGSGRIAQVWIDWKDEGGQFELPYDFLKEVIARRLANEVNGIGAVTYGLHRNDENRPGVTLWAVWSENGFTADAAELPYTFLKKVAAKIVQKFRDVSVDYRISGKPPSTIELG